MPCLLSGLWTTATGDTEKSHKEGGGLLWILEQGSENPRAGQDHEGHSEEEGGRGQARGRNLCMPSAKMVLLAPGCLTQFLIEKKLTLISLFHRIVFLSICVSSS